MTQGNYKDKSTPKYDALVKGMRETIFESWREMQDERMMEASEKGLIEVLAYYCNRCNYVWLPRDFGYNWRERKRGYFGHDLEDREPPKSCARCKSRNWRETVPKRRIRKDVISKLWGGKGEWADRKTRKYLPRWYVNKARFRALQRQGKLTSEGVTQALTRDDIDR